MRSNRYTTAEVRKILDLRGQGKSFHAIAKELGRSTEGVRRAWKKHVNDTGSVPPEVTQKGGPPADKIDLVENSTELNGDVSVLKYDRTLSPAELKEAAGLGDDWIATHYTPNFWDGYYKVTRDGQAGHKKVRLFQSKASFKRIIGEELKEAILEFCRENVKPMRVPPNRRTCTKKVDSKGGQVVSWGLWDAHIGMYAFGEEVGSDYDVKIATNRCLNSIDDMIEELALYDIRQIWMPIGNDFMHFDNVRQRTTRGEHDLDADSRFARAYLAATNVVVYMVQRATEICDNVQVFYCPGNHDTLTSYTLIGMLAQRFLNDSRVSVDLNCNPQTIKRHGGVAIMYEHGQNVAPNQFPLIFHEHVMNDARENNLRRDLTYREVQVGHRHQKRTRVYESEVPTNGISIVTNPALCNTDFYHHSRGLIGEPMKSVEAYRYDELGRRGSHVCWARDDERK